MGIREAGKKKKHEQRAGETVRRNDEAGSDPFLQASNLVADIMENGYPHAHTNLKTDTRHQTPADKNTHTHTRRMRQPADKPDSPSVASSVTFQSGRLWQIYRHLNRHWKISHSDVQTRP